MNIHSININQKMQYISLGPVSFEMRTQEGTNFLREHLQCTFLGLHSAGEGPSLVPISLKIGSPWHLAKLVKSNSKSGRFPSFFMPNNFGTVQKSLIFWCFRKLNHGQRTTFIKGLSPDSKKTPPKSWIRGHRTVQTAHCAVV